MKFRTEVEIPISDKKIQISDAIFSIGSCFATEIHEKLSAGQLLTFHNPFGTIFNPFAIDQCIQQIRDKKIYDHEDLVTYQGEFLSLHHHTSFNSHHAEETLMKINQKIVEAQDFLAQTQWIIITYGTAYTYEFLPQNILAANCHKLPQKFFKKRFLTHEELTASIQKTIENLKSLCKKDVNILLSISPVRHTKDGMVENNLSKAKLINAVHEVIIQHPQCSYLPIYEIVLDDLRDYRFYKEDFIHPNQQAVQYIWEKFGKSYFSAETQIFIEENLKIKQALSHRPQSPHSPKHQEFLAQIKEKISLQQRKVKHPIFQN